MGKGGARQFASQRDEPFAVGFAHRAADGRLGLAGGGDLKPCRLRRLPFGCDDLDRLAVFHTGPERHAHPVHLGTHAGVADPRVDRIGEIDGRSPARQLYHLTLGREAKDLIRIHLKLDCLKKVLVIILTVELFGQLRNPFRGIDRKGVLAAHPVPVGPMRRHAGFGHVMHLAGPDLHLNPLAITARHRGVNRPVAVGLGLADIILEPPRHRPPALVDRAQRAVNVTFGVGDDPKTINVTEPGEGLLLFLHLAPDRIGLLGPAKDLGLDPRLFQLKPHVAGDPLDHVAGFALHGDEAADDGRTAFGIDDLERQILKFLAHPLHPHAPGQRRKDVHGLARFLHLFVGPHRPNGAHIVQAVTKLDQNDPHVLGHRHKEFPEIFGLFGLDAAELEIG
mmetsp:Transcript_28501/g.53455  ORF Transcript_28501/g.53455 Transcript_28501/m.53455 type:complete len:394 (+) Transcript_28501:2917-4098(+)